jgi:hypothetical protein|tara:strand:- start:597 stop:908 length:312 start_codon:yes stop_codon:yes gene_type:complete
MAKQKYITSFDVDTITANTKKDRALSVSKAGNLNLDAKVANPTYDKKAKEGPDMYAMKSIRECFDFFILKEDGSVAFKLQDHITLSGGTAVTAFAREWSTESK